MASEDHSRSSCLDNNVQRLKRERLALQKELEVLKTAWQEAIINQPSQQQLQTENAHLKAALGKLLLLGDQEEASTTRLSTLLAAGAADASINHEGTNRGHSTLGGSATPIGASRPRGTAASLHNMHQQECLLAQLSRLQHPQAVSATAGMQDDSPKQPHLDLRHNLATTPALPSPVVPSEPHANPTNQEQHGAAMGGLASNHHWFDKPLDNFLDSSLLQPSTLRDPLPVWDPAAAGLKLAPYQVVIDKHPVAWELQDNPWAAGARAFPGASEVVWTVPAAQAPAAPPQATDRHAATQRKQHVPSHNVADRVAGSASVIPAGAQEAGVMVGGHEQPVTGHRHYYSGTPASAGGAGGGLFGGPVSKWLVSETQLQDDHDGVGTPRYGYGAAAGGDNLSLGDYPQEPAEQAGAAPVTFGAAWHAFVPKQTSRGRWNRKARADKQQRKALALGGMINVTQQGNETGAAAARFVTPCHSSAAGASPKKAKGGRTLLAADSTISSSSAAARKKKKQCHMVSNQGHSSPAAEEAAAAAGAGRDPTAYSPKECDYGNDGSVSPGAVCHISRQDVMQQQQCQAGTPAGKTKHKRQRSVSADVCSALKQPSRAQQQQQQQGHVQKYQQKRARVQSAGAASMSASGAAKAASGRLAGRQAIALEVGQQSGAAPAGVAAGCSIAGGGAGASVRGDQAVGRPRMSVWDRLEGGREGVAGAAWFGQGLGVQSTSWST